MPHFEVRPVSTRRDKRRFLTFPWRLYKDDPNWVPPLRLNQKELVGYRRHPFYEDAEIQTFLAVRDGSVCGRVAAILNHAHNRVHVNEQRGFIGFFESINDQAVANGLLDAAKAWFAQREVYVLRGPANPSLNYECGMLVKNFEMPPTFMMTYNPSYYPQLWENYGFVKAQDLLTFIGFERDLETLEKKVQFVAQESAKRFNIAVRPISRRTFQRDVETFLQIYNASLEGIWGHVPMSAKEVVHTARSLKFLLVPEVSLIAEIGGKPVGSVLGLLNYNPRIKKIDGRLFPWGFLWLLLGRKKIHRLRMVSTNVLPEYQRWGVGVILAANLLQPALEFGMVEGEFSWVLESNHLSRKTLERAKLAIEKVHRIYDYEQSPTPAVTRS